MKGIYLGAYKASHPDFNIVYQDINGKRDLDGDMMNVNLDEYDFIIATPPCNYWSRARGNRCSQYSLNTKHLLPDILDKLIHINKPWIVENVKNDKRMIEEHIIPRDDCYIYYLNRHIYFSNVVLQLNEVNQRQDFKYGGRVIKYDDMKDKDHQGGFNVHNVIEEFLYTISKKGGE